MREYKFLEQHMRREFVRRRKFSILEKNLEAQVECLDTAHFLASKLPRGYQPQLSPLQQQQEFGTLPPVPYHLLAPDQESTLDRRGRVWCVVVCCGRCCCSPHESRVCTVQHMHM